MFCKVIAFSQHSGGIGPLDYHGPEGARGQFLGTACPAAAHQRHTVFQGHGRRVRIGEGMARAGGEFQCNALLCRKGRGFGVDKARIRHDVRPGFDGREVRALLHLIHDAFPVDDDQRRPGLARLAHGFGKQGWRNVAQLHPGPRFHVGVKAKPAHLRGHLRELGEVRPVAGSHQPGKAYPRKRGIAQGRRDAEARPFRLYHDMEIRHGNSPCRIIGRKRKKRKEPQGSGYLGICAL